MAFEEAPEARQAILRAANNDLEHILYTLPEKEKQQPAAVLARRIVELLAI